MWAAVRLELIGHLDCKIGEEHAILTPRRSAVNRGSCVRILLTVTRDAVSIILVVFCPLRVGRSVCIRCTQQVLFSLVLCRLNLCTVSCAQS